MNGNADGPCLVGNRSGDGLPDPPGRIGGEFKALGVIELFNRLNQAEVSLLNQIEELHPPAQITLRNAHDKAQVSLGKAFFSNRVPF